MHDNDHGLKMFVIYCITIATILCIAICAAIESKAYDQPIETEAMIEKFDSEDEVEAEESFGPELRTRSEVVQEPVVEPTPEPEIDILVEEVEPVAEPVVMAAADDIELPEIGYLAGDPAIYLAKTVWGEARGCTPMEQAAVVWCVLNRVDSELAYMPDDIISVITQIDGHGHYHFRGYSPDFPVTDEIYDLVVDVLARWELEKTGVEDVGRVLPKEYLYFHGDGAHNHFRDEYSGGNRWDWSLPNPYE